MSVRSECLEREIEELRAAVAARNVVILNLAAAAMDVMESSRGNVAAGNCGQVWTGVDDEYLANLECLADRGRKAVTS